MRVYAGSKATLDLMMPGRVLLPLCPDMGCYGYVIGGTDGPVLLADGCAYGSEEIVRHRMVWKAWKARVEVANLKTT